MANKSLKTAKDVNYVSPALEMLEFEIESSLLLTTSVPPGSGPAPDMTTGVDGGHTIAKPGNVTTGSFSAGKSRVRR